MLRCLSKLLQVFARSNHSCWYPVSGQLACLSKKPIRSKATILQSPLYCGEGRFLLDIFTGIVVGTVKLHLENLVVNTQDAVPEFHVGEAVMVAERTIRGAPNPEHGWLIFWGANWTIHWSGFMMFSLSRMGRGKNLMCQVRFLLSLIWMKLSNAKKRWTVWCFKCD